MTLLPVPRATSGRAVVSLLAFVLACAGGNQTDSPPPTAVPDTAFLSAEAAVLAELTIAAAESLAWQESWSASRSTAMR
jgi:hypothetical protein